MVNQGKRKKKYKSPLDCRRFANSVQKPARPFHKLRISPVMYLKKTIQNTINLMIERYGLILYIYIYRVRRAYRYGEGLMAIFSAIHCHRQTRNNVKGKVILWS